MADQKRLTTILGHLKAASSPTSSSYGGTGPQQISVRTPKDKYRYTLDSSASILTPDQRDFYEENGFLVVKGLVPLDDLDKYKERFKLICTKEVEVSRRVCVKGDLGEEEGLSWWLL